MKRQISYVLCILMLVFISGCAMNDDTTVNHASGVISDISELSEEENNHKEEALPDVRSGADVSEEMTAPAGEGQQDVKSMDSVDKRMMLYGNCELGCGWLLYTVPDQEDQDYKIYFFADKSKDYEDRYKSFEEMDFNLEQADYVFPDARENNMAIGKFIDMCMYEPFVMESGESAWIVFATYETGGRQYYDTRIYKWSEEGYVIDETMTEELNALYSDVEEYPIWQIVEMSHD